MKALIAAACVAVILAVGYYFWGEYSHHAEQAAANAAANTAMEAKRAALFTLANAGKSEDDMVRAWCKLAKMRIDGGIWESNATAAAAVGDCRHFGYL